MARSSYIYIIVHAIPDADEPVIAAFTVKHECLSWLEECEHPYKRQFEVRRLKDNDYTETYRSEWTHVDKKDSQ